MRDVDSSVVSQHQFTAVDDLDGLVHARGVDNRLAVGLVVDRRELVVLQLEAEARILLLLVVLISVEVPAVHETVPSSRNEARVIVHPVQASH